MLAPLPFIEKYLIEDNFKQTNFVERAGSWRRLTARGSNATVHILCKLKTTSEFVFKLVGAKHKMSLGNSELTNSDKSVHLTRILISEKR